MRIKNVFQRLPLGFLVLVLVFSFGACSTDDENSGRNENESNVFNPYVLSLAIQGSEGNFTYYTVPFADVMSGTLDAVGRGIEQPGYYDFIQIDNTIYSIGGLDDVDMVGIEKNVEERSLEKVGNIAFDNSLSDILKADNNTLVSVTMDSSLDILTFRKLDANSITVIDEKSVPASVLFDFGEKEGPNYSGMEISGDYLFLSFYISNSETFETKYTDTARVAVFSYPEFEFEKVITDARVGPIGGFNVKSGLIKDEQGNIYAISHSNPANGFSQFTKPSGILKINAGETEFNPDYFFDISAAADGGNTAHISYLGNGKIFAEINTATRAAQEMWSDSPLRSAVLNLENKTVHFIDGVPTHKGTGRRLPILQEGAMVYLCIPEGDGIYVYQMNTDSYTAVKGAKVQANFVAGIFKL